MMLSLTCLFLKSCCWVGSFRSSISSCRSYRQKSLNSLNTASPNYRYLKVHGRGGFCGSPFSSCKIMEEYSSWMIWCSYLL